MIEFFNSLFFPFSNSVVWFLIFYFNSKNGKSIFWMQIESNTEKNKQCNCSYQKISSQVNQERDIKCDIIRLQQFEWKSDHLFKPKFRTKQNSNKTKAYLISEVWIAFDSSLKENCPVCISAFCFFSFTQHIFHTYHT